ncbi:MAG TPA: CsbD family protein [Tepidisphaeraceae bacterium]|nr:CsbD family protein [Tepidisphaeraceae bacterium]
MGSEDVAAGKIKQAKGKANDVAGAIRSDPAQQLKGKVQKGVGKVQEEFGKATRPGHKGT